MAAMIASPPSGAIPFGDLLEALRRQGFPIGLDHYVRLHSLLELVGSDCEPHQLKTLLCPIFATSREQQEQFYRAFDLSYPMFAHAAHASRHPGAADELMPVAAKRSRLRTSLYALAGLATTAVAVVVVWQTLIQRPRPPLAPPQPAPVIDSSVAPAPGPEPAAGQPTGDTALAPPAPQPQPAVAPVVPPPVLESFAVRHAKLLQALAVAIPLLLFGLNEWRLYRRRRLVIQRQRREKPPFVWPIKVPQPGNPFAESAELQFAARLLREREQGEIARLAVDESVTATIEAMGYPTFRFRTDTRPPDYLVLIERAAFRDHGARLFNDLGRALEREGVHIARYYYDGDPRICHPESGGDRTLLVDLRRRYPAHRLLVFGTGEAFISPISGRLHTWTSDFLSWNDRALFTPEAPRGWSQREVTLARHFILLPATLQGLVALVDHFRTPVRPSLRAWRDRSTEPLPPSPVGTEVWQLRTYLGEPAFRWLAACAVYPELHWDLTLHLGQIGALPPDLITEQNLLRLLRLPWFRAGALPDELRGALVAELDPETERAVRTAIVELLEADPAPTDSVAGNQYDLELVVQRLSLSQEDRKRRRELLKQVQTMPHKQVMGDFAVLQLLERAPSTRLAMMLPARLRQVFFKEGIPALGTRAGLRAGVTLVLALSAFVLTRPSAIPPFGVLAVIGDEQMLLAPGDTLRLLASEVARLAPWRGSLPPGMRVILPVGGDASWSSTRPEVARVDSLNKLAGVAPGTAMVITRTAAGMQVIVDVRVDTTSLAFALGSLTRRQLDSLTLTPGDVRALGLIIPKWGGRAPDPGASTVEWSSSDPRIVRTGRAGEIEAVAPGRAEVIASGYGREQRLAVRVGPAAAGTTDTARVAEDITSVVSNWALAIASRDLRSLVALYPSMPDSQQQAWALFFRSTSGARANLSVGAYRHIGDTVLAPVAGSYSYVIRSGGQWQRNAVNMLMTLVRNSGGWRITAIGDDAAASPALPLVPGAEAALVASIRVFPESLTLVAGINRPVTLTARAYDRAATEIPSAGFTFSTRDRGVIELAPDGTVSPAGDTGHAVVVVTSGTVSTRVGVTVRAARIVRTGLELEPSRVVLKVGERSRLTPHFYTVDEAGRQVPAERAALWRSDDPSVATVSGDGTVTAVAAGRATISAGDSTRFLSTAAIEVQPAEAAAPTAPTVLVLDAAALSAIESRVDAAMASLSAGRLADPGISLVYPGTEAASRQRARNQLAVFFRDTDFKARGPSKEAPKVVGQQVEVDFQVPFEWHDSFGRSRKQTAMFQAVLAAAGGGWDLKEIRLLKAFP